MICECNPPSTTTGLLLQLLLHLDRVFQSRSSCVFGLHLIFPFFFHSFFFFPALIHPSVRRDSLPKAIWVLLCHFVALISNAFYVQTLESIAPRRFHQLDQCVKHGGFRGWLNITEVAASLDVFPRWGGQR